MHFTCRSFLGKTTPTSWSQYWENEPDDPTIISCKGHLFGLINLNFPSEDTSKLGHQIIQDINTAYFSSPDADISSSLVKAIDSINQDSLFLILAVVYKGRLYLSIRNSGLVVLVRRDKISQILTGQTNKTVSINGPLENEDKFFLSTSAFLAKFTWTKIKAILDDKELETVEENFLSTLYSFDDQSGLAAALIEVHSDDNEPFSREIPSATPPPPHSTSRKLSLPKPNLIGFVKRVFSKKPVFVSYHDIKEIGHRKKINLIFGLLLLIGLLTASFFGYKKNRAAHLESQYQQYRSELEDKLKNATAVKNLNLDSALDLARQSQSILEKIKALKTHQSELSGYQDQVNLLLSQTGSADNFSPDLFYDTALIVSNPSYSKAFFKSPSLFLLDTSRGRVDVLNVSEKSIKNLSLTEAIKNYTSFAENNDNIYLLNNDHLALVKKNELETKLIFSESSSSATPTDLQFWNGALYLLTQNNLQKFTPNISGFGAAQSWLKDNQKLPPVPTSLAINGKVWILSQNGTITPYVRGVKDNFKPSQAVSATSAANLVTTLDSNILAFTDADNLIYVYKKDGEILARYNLGTKKILDIALDEKNNSIFILCADQKIYKIAL